jgi:hypothetical protein
MRFYGLIFLKVTKVKKTANTSKLKILKLIHTTPISVMITREVIWTRGEG